jgi:hypothetical protein
VHAVAAFNVDKERLNWADTAVMVLPAGRSCHMEFGYMRGQHKNCHILMTQEPDRYDLMYRFAHGIWCNMDDLAQALVEGNFNVEW